MICATFTKSVSINRGIENISFPCYPVNQQSSLFVACAYPSPPAVFRKQSRFQQDEGRTGNPRGQLRGAHSAIWLPDALNAVKNQSWLQRESYFADIIIRPIVLKVIPICNGSALAERELRSAPTASKLCTKSPNPKPRQLAGFRVDWSQLLNEARTFFERQSLE